MKLFLSSQKKYYFCTLKIQYKFKTKKMAAIGSIRKHGVLLMIIIGVALVLFLLTGLFDGNTLYRVFASEQFSMGKIDGENVDDEYRVLFEQNSALLKVLQNKASFDEAETYQIHQITWEQLLDEKIVNKQLAALGIFFTDEVVESILDDAKMSLSTQQPNPYLASYFQFLASSVGPENAQAIISSIEEYRDMEQARDIYTSYKAIERRIIFERKVNTYLTFAQGTVHFSDALAQKFATNNKVAMTALVSINPNLSAFNELNAEVTDKDIKSWYNQHKNRYISFEDTRDIDVAVFPIAPTVEDKNAIEKEVRDTYEKFAAVSVIDSFNMVNMYSPLDSLYHKKGDNIMINSQSGYMAISVSELDSLIFDAPVGSMIEPYNYQDVAWFFGKTYGFAYRPDSVLVAYLLVDHKSSQNPDAARTKAKARREADSLKTVISNGQASIFSLIPSYLGGRQVGADTTMWYEENFTNRKLYNGLVNTSNGGCYVDEIPSAFVVYQVLTRTSAQPKRQYVLYSFDIEPSEATVASIRANASQLAAASTSSEDFIEEANNRGVQLVRGTDVTSMMASINQIQNCRPLVSWAFGENTEKDAISDVIKLDERMFVVGAVKNIKLAGTPKLAEVKDQISDELKNIKKIEAVKNQIKADLASGSSINAIATKYNTNFSDSTRLTFGGESYMNRGLDNKAIGQVFASEPNKTEVIEGRNMIYVTSVYNFQDQMASPDLQNEKTALRNITTGRARNEMLILQGLKEKMDIWDNRARFYPN